MAFTEPRYEVEEINAAGDALIGRIEWPEFGLNPISVINNHRSSHSYPLNTFQVTLKKRATAIDSDALVTTRLKRLPAIEDKLSRIADLRLAEMQDIGGCRAVVTTVPQVYDLAREYRESRSASQLIDSDDYIRGPKSTGYRGVHLIYRHSSKVHPVYDDLRIELQFRTTLQHAWATAVETVDVFEREGLKSNRGSEDWKRFFALASTAIALREGYRRVPRTPSDPTELRAELTALEAKLNVLHNLEVWGRTMRIIGQVNMSKSTHYVILESDTEAGISLYGFRAGQSEAAAAKYAELEANKPPSTDVVLVTVSRADSLQKAYPNYYLDTELFTEIVRQEVDA